MPSRGNFSLRQFAVFLGAVFVSAFLWVLLQSPLAHAADATWQSDNISYDSKTYQPESSTTIPSIPQGATVYSSKDKAAGTASVIYYDGSTDTTKEIKAKVIEYTLANDDTFSNPSPPKDISLDAKSTSKTQTQCSIAGVGWIVCTVSRWIASGMDNVFVLISGYLEVSPITTDTDSGLYKAWEIGRSIANLVFVLAFLLIIYAQITSVGMSNYEIKKMIPKLIVAAILVNLSYYICGIAVDISNILGHSVQQAFIDIRNSLPGINTSYKALTFKNITEYILSGGTIAAGGIMAFKAFTGAAMVQGSFQALGLMLSPVLIGALLALIVALLVLAARQALIIVLIVISPLAFVAMLLPNTEKWFDKWKEVFTTMLLVFPMFSLLFGGSQLASYIVIQNTDQLSVMIFAMFIQAAPLALTPFLIKFSGSLLGRFAGMMNNPQKGIIDRTRNWAQDKAETRAAMGQEKVARGRGHMFQRYARGRTLDQSNRDAWKARGKAWTEAAWENDSRNHLHHKRKDEAEQFNKVGKAASGVEIANHRLKDPNMSRMVAKTRLDEDLAKNLGARQDAAWEEMRAGKNTNQFGVAPGVAPTLAQRAYNHELAGMAMEASQEAKALAHRSAMAQSVQNTSYSNRVLRDAVLAQDAGGVLGEAGITQAKAQALQNVRADFGKNSAAIKEMMDHFKLSGGQVKDIANMRQDVVVSKDGVDFTFKANDEYAIDAAIESIFEKKGNYADMKEIVVKSGTAAYEPYLATIAAGVASKMTAKAGFMGGRSIDTVVTGGVASRDQFDDVIRSAIAGGKFKQEFFATNDTEALKDVYRIMRNNMNAGSLDAGEAAQFHENVQKLSKMAKATLANESISSNLTEGSLAVLRRIMGQFDTGD